MRTTYCTALLFTALLLLCPSTSIGQTRHPVKFKQMARSEDMEWFATQEARQAADSAMRYQYPCGGWAKNHDWHTLESEEKMKERSSILKQIAKGESLGATIDNGATTHEMMLLAKVYAAAVNDRQVKKKVLKGYRDAFVRGVAYLVEAQYDNGGWPQFYPFKPLDKEGHAFYSNHITFNDDAMHNVLVMLRDIYEQQQPYDALRLEPALLNGLRQAFDKGIDCILKCQIKKDGKLTVWCQQHDETTFAPAPARAYELASFTGSHETASLLRLLMSLKQPSDSVVQAVTAAVEWLKAHALQDVELQEFTNREGKADRRLVHKFGSKTWARYYDLNTEEPYVCDRDGVQQPSLEYIGYERRNGYGWYGEAPASIIKKYPKWLKEVRP